MSNKKLWIFEKPNVARAVVEVLPKPHVSKDGYIETGDGIVSWVFGHILEQYSPKDYNENLKWDIGILPIIPQEWKLKPISDKSAQLRILKKLIKDADVVVNGGDHDREGQLLVDEVLEFVGYKKKALRYICGSLEKTDIKKAVNDLKNNDDYRLFKESALGRQRADWLVGMNMTMGLTSLAQSQQQYGGVLSIGRVQTPTLALVVERDLEIENFKPQTYYALSAEFMSDNMKFWTRWIPQGKSLEDLEKMEKREETGEFEDDDEETLDDNSTPWLKDSKIIDPIKAQEIFLKIKQAGTGVVSNYSKVEAKEKQPLPNNLGDVQRKLGSKYGHSLQEVLDACQTLYEAGYTTYPRSDSNYLTEGQYVEAPEILSAIKEKGIYEDLIDNTDVKIKTACWNDKKVVEHHAIIPTLKAPDISKLTPVQKHVYEEVTKSYIAQFYPECLVDRTKIEVVIAEERFSASGRTVKSLGWRVVFGSDDQNTKEPTLPPLSKGQSLPLTDLKKEEKQTTPPPRYTEHSLGNIMANIHRVMKDPAERKQLKGDGLGRTATRTGIINTLLKRGFLMKSGKYIISTETGRTVIKVAPKAVSSPSLTAQWEKALNLIFEGKFSLADFEKKQHDFIKILLNELKQTKLPQLPEVKKGGSSYSKGKSSSSSSAKKTTTTKSSSGKKCPQCKKGELVTKKITKGSNAGKSFKGCSNYPECKYTEWPK